MSQELICLTREDAIAEAVEIEFAMMNDRMLIRVLREGCPGWNSLCNEEIEDFLDCHSLDCEHRITCPDPTLSTVNQ